MEESHSTVIQPKLDSNSKIRSNESEQKRDSLEATLSMTKNTSLNEEKAHALIRTNIKDIDWLGSIFINKDIKYMLICLFIIHI